jgi:hypothetical protein
VRGGAGLRPGEWLAITLAVSAGLALLLELHARPPQVDDAYISYRYAANLVEGHGLVFNPGERVEGFTNLLWTLAVAGGVALGLEAPAVGHGLGLLSGLAALAAAYALCRVTLPAERAVWAGAAPWLLYVSLPFALWSTSGLETALFAALGTAAFTAQAVGRIGWATGLAVASTLTRPEGGLVALILFGSHLLTHGPTRLRAWRAPLVFAGFALALTGFRLAYYGAPLPNTFYAKVGGVPLSQGVRYATDFLVDGAAWLLPPALLAAWQEPRLRPAALYAAASFAYVIAIGGDGMPYGRLLVPALPCLAGMAARGAAGAFSTGRGLRLAAVACLLGAVVGQAVGWPIDGESWRRPKRLAELETAHTRRASVVRSARNQANQLRWRGESPALLATAGIGAIGYYNRVPILDLLGLVDPVIARTPTDPGSKGLAGHRRSNANYVLKRRPDYIMIPQRGDAAQIVRSVPAIQKIWEHPDFERLYEWDRWMRAYRRREAPRGPHSPKVPQPAVD